MYGAGRVKNNVIKDYIKVVNQELPPEKELLKGVAILLVMVNAYFPIIF